MSARRPSDLGVDLLFVVALGVVSLAGLATTYNGVQFLVVGVLGLLVGAGLAWLTVRLGWPFIAAVLLALVAFYLLGGALTLRSAGAVAPTPHTLSLLTDQVLFGWKDLLTTLPPIEADGPLLVLPWFLGLVAGVSGVLLARVRRGPVWLSAALPLLAPLALVATVILIGVERPQSLLLQGFGFGVLALAWLGTRVRRRSGTVHGTRGRATRLVTAGALVGAAGLVALPIGTWASDGDERVILRDHVEPPFDIGQYASPLSSFRRYVEDPDAGPANVYDDPLFRVGGVPAGTRLRIAALDSYDGVVWGAGADTVPGSSADTFQRVSSEVHNPARGKDVDVEVTVEEGWSGPWLPTVGALQELHFTEGDVDAKAESFRYNLATSTAVVPSGLQPGDRYSFRARVDDRVLTRKDTPGAAGVAEMTNTEFLATQEAEWSVGETASMARLFAIADKMVDELKYSDGVKQLERIYHAGHHVRRLDEEFVNAPTKAGNDEQYAAVFAILANRLGIPARVVMGAVVPEDGVVHGRDVWAWVEVRVGDGSWRTVPTETFMNFDKPAEVPPQTQEQLSGMVVPPPAPIPPPSTMGEQTDAELNAQKNRRKDGDGDGFSVPGWLRALLVYAGTPLLLLAAIVAAIIGAKAGRRRRRRTHARVSARFVGAWRELVDHARDLGATVPGGTRREQALVLASSGAPALAQRADQHVFGPVAPDEQAAEAYWEAVEQERRSMLEGLPRLKRWLAAVNLVSFLRR